MSAAGLDAQVVIAGGGIAGSGLLHALARRGVDVMLIERGEGPSGASTLPAALLNPHRGRSGRARPLDLLGLEAFWRLGDRLARAGLEPGTHHDGVVRIASNARQAAAWRRLAALGTPRWLEPEEIPDPYHGPFGGVLVPDGGWVEPGRLLAALRTAARADGARYVGGVELVGWRPTPGGGLTVATVGGEDRSPRELHARALVLCLGAYDAGRCRLPRLELAPGVAVTFVASASPIVPEGTPPLAGAIAVVPTASGIVVSGGVLPRYAGETGAAVWPEREDEAAAVAVGAAVERLRAAASWYLPALDGAADRSAGGSAVVGAPISAALGTTVSATWYGTRARRPSGTPVVRRLAPGVTLFGALAGRGFLCGPLLAERLAERLAAGLATGLP